MEYVSSSSLPGSPRRRFIIDRALYEDSCLYVVPNTHTSPRTGEQRAQSMTQTPPADPLDMPGAIQVTLQRQSKMRPFIRNFLHCPNI
jgi:hypothetical protein